MNNLKQPVYLGARTSLLPAQVTHLEAEINYTTVYMALGQKQILSSTIKTVYEFLKPHGDFVRISKKHVVNMEFVKSTSPDSLTLKNGLTLNPSRRRKRDLFNVFT
ncbi:LytTR family DNA-binding domain-containing protein [uncultured Arcticibacterium sp.]|uniref:LytTR family DNA-binding domain-containing protein n=1 Tax=uncultured Arcticibacterium sp. TaxID=2173042 RepID=UPI0030F5814D